MILPTDIVEEVLSPHDDLYIRPGPAPTNARRPTGAAGGGAAGPAATGAVTNTGTGTCVLPYMYEEHAQLKEPPPPSQQPQTGTGGCAAGTTAATRPSPRRRTRRRSAASTRRRQSSTTPRRAGPAAPSASTTGTSSTWCGLPGGASGNLLGVHCRLSHPCPTHHNQIAGCATGPHSTVDPKELFAPSPTVSAAARVSCQLAP